MGAEGVQARRNSGRFAPSTTGRAHPGTLLAALLCWLDARSRGLAVALRLEDLDRERSKPEWVEAMVRDLAWFGLDWDATLRQSSAQARHDAIVDRLVRAGRVYACRCSRTRIRETGAPAPDGSHRYAGHCRDRVVGPNDWRSVPDPLRLRLEPGFVALRDESGLDLSGDPEAIFGDPLLRRRDGAWAYHFVSVVDDADLGVVRVVRGRDLAPSTTLQVAIARHLGLPTPTYRHHCLLLERRGDKLSKLHGAVALPDLRERHDAAALCGLLAASVGLVAPGTRCRPADLVADFDWVRVSNDDVVLAWRPETGLTALSGPLAAGSRQRSAC
ncbi:MAG: glutamate--tRNA ligase family protein [Myxococcota bacterium]